MALVDEDHIVLHATHTFYPQVEWAIPAFTAQLYSIAILELAWVAGYVPRWFARRRSPIPIPVDSAVALYPLEDSATYLARPAGPDIE